MPPEDVVKELQSKKWADNMVEVHATTLDGRVSDTLGCFLKGKGDQVSIYFSDHSLYSFLLITILILFTVLLTHSHYLLLVIVDQSSRHILLLIHFTLSLSLCDVFSFVELVSRLRAYPCVDVGTLACLQRKS
jgi:hypothetical protein